MSAAVPSPAAVSPERGAALRPPMRLGYRICRLICHALYVGLFRGRAFGVRNVPHTGGVLLVSNHQSFLDPMLATLAIPRECHYMARDTLFDHNGLREVMTYLNAFPIKRDTADMRGIKETLRRLKAGHVVLTFPEGTRTRDGSIGPMRGGVAVLGRKARVPLVPTLVQGAFKCWPRTAKWPRPSPVIVAYGEPVYPHEHPEWSDEECVERVRGIILGLQVRYASHPILQS